MQTVGWCEGTFRLEVIYSNRQGHTLKSNSVKRGVVYEHKRGGSQFKYESQSEQVIVSSEFAPWVRLPEFSGW